jgi:serine/threonine-protein kinase
MLERIGNCRIVEEVASGGMAVVYRAVQDELQRTVAIKALKTAVATEEALVTRFEREAQSLANLQHENIIHIYDFYRERGALFIVMEYVEGIDLYDLLDTSGRLPIDVAAIIAMQVARALDYIHYRGIIHRDIKPANIMVGRQGGVKLMDFGIARDRNYESDLTETGTGIGTPSYMSPEQILGDPLDARSDIFSIGIVLYQMVTGKKPFVEDERFSVMHRIRLEKHERARKINPDVPRELEHIIDKCLAKEPRHRYRSAQQLVMALERFLSKHVEMNYHSRLVLFLRNQDVITQLEADEYLNPEHGEVLTPQALQARRTIRRTALFHGAVLGVVALWALSIHLLPVGREPLPSPNAILARVGYLDLVVHPWAVVTVGGKETTTPQAAPLQLPAGKHEFLIKHPAFRDVKRKVEIEEGPVTSAQKLIIDLEREGKRR